MLELQTPKHVICFEVHKKGNSKIIHCALNLSIIHNQIMCMQSISSSFELHRKVLIKGNAIENSNRHSSCNLT